MKTRSAIAGAALFACAAITTVTGTATAATVTPGPGTYGMTIYDVSQKGATCTGGVSAVGGTSVGTLYYPGPGQPGTTIYAVKNGGSDFGFTIVSLPKAPAIGVRSWSGPVSIQAQPAGKSLTGTFKGTLTVIDLNHFLLTLTVVQGGCTQVKHIVAYSVLNGVGKDACCAVGG